MNTSMQAKQSASFRSFIQPPLIQSPCSRMVYLKLDGSSSTILSPGFFRIEHTIACFRAEATTMSLKETFTASQTQSTITPPGNFKQLRDARVLQTGERSKHFPEFYSHPQKWTQADILAPLDHLV